MKQSNESPTLLCYRIMSGGEGFWNVTMKTESRNNVLLISGIALIFVILVTWTALSGNRAEIWLEATRTFLQDRGWWIILPYTLAIILLGAIGVPPAILILPAAYVWPWTVSLPVSLVGGLCSALLGFWLSRHLAQEWAEKRIPPKVRVFEKRLERHGLGTVIVLRLLFFLFPPVSWLLGLSHITLTTYCIGTVIGSLPFLLVLVFTGQGVIPWLLHLPPGILPAILLSVLTGVVCWIVWMSRDETAGEVKNG